MQTNFEKFLKNNFWLLCRCHPVAAPLSTGVPLRGDRGAATGWQVPRGRKMPLKKFWWYTYRRKILRGSRIWGYFFDKPPQKWSKRAICFKFFEIWVFPKFLKSWINCIFWPFFDEFIDEITSESASSWNFASMGMSSKWLYHDFQDF